jgi:hypothetical protein
MTSKASPDRSRELDQFYTDPTYAAHFLNQLYGLMEFADADVLLEPSAGTGSFFNLLDPVKRVGLDLEPKAAGIQQQDFFDYQPPVGKRIWTVGNPPFGKNASLAVKFFNRSAEFSDVIAFIIPRTFRKASVINRLDKNFHLVYDETVPANSFIFQGNSYDVWCCAQIWVRGSVSRDKIKVPSLKSISKYFTVVDPAQADFAVQRVGGGAGDIKTQNHQRFSPLSHYFIKAHDPDVLDIMKQVDFSAVKYNTAGNPSVSAGELVELWSDAARAAGKVL